MARYEVGYVLRDWVSVEVTADTPEEAIERANKIIRRRHNKTGFGFNDGKENVVGITNVDVLDLLDD